MKKDNILAIIKKINSLSGKQQEALINFLKKKGIDISLIEKIPRRSLKPGEKCPLSFAQQRLWFLAKLEGTNAYYNIPMVLRLSGNLNQQALIHTLVTIVERHEVLRTRFIESDGVPYQILDDIKNFCVSEEVLLAENDLRSICEAEALIPFNLDTEKLFRAKLLKQSETEHVLLVTMHHSVSDGWSMGVFFREVVSLYNAFCDNKPSPLTPLSIQYADFAHWQRQWLVDEMLESQLSYWKQHLHGISPQLALPTDRPRPLVKTYNGATETFQCSVELLKQLQRLSEKQEATLYMTLLSAFAILLKHYTHQTDIAIGTPIANRNRLEIENLIGFFVNTLVIRNDLSGDPRFIDFLSRTKKIALEAYSHQDVPFESVVEALQVERSLSYSPLFQVMFVLQETEADRSAFLRGLYASSVEYEFNITKFDLTLEVRATSNGLQGHVEYNTDLFDRKTIQRLILHYTKLLAEILATPDMQISKFELLAEEERHQFLLEWNANEESYTHTQCLHELFEAQAKQNPNNIALIFDNERLTYTELNAKANQVAHYLHQEGVKPDMLVGLCVERSLEMVIGILGILKAGGAYVPIDPTYPTERIRYILEDSGVTLLLTQSHLLEQLPITKQQVIYLDTNTDAQGNPSIISKQLTTNIDKGMIGLNLNHLAYVIYTSGSTGKPKGVLVQHSNVTRLFYSTEEKFHFGPNDVWTLFHSFSFDFSVWELWGALIYGGSVVIVPKQIAQSSLDFYQLLIRERVTILNQTPTVFEQLIGIDLQEKSPLYLRTIIFGGEALNPAILKPWFACHSDTEIQLINMYGITETTVHVTYQRLYEHGENQKSIIGKKLSDLKLYVLNDQLSLVPIGVTGEIYVGGAGVTRGYLNRPELTQERFIQNPFNNDISDRLYKTGDLARWLSDGNLEFVSRADDQVKIRGFRIELGEIESHLLKHELVHSCVVMVREDIPGNKQLVAYVVLHGKYGDENIRSIDIDYQIKLRQFLQKVLADYMVPNIYVALDTLPITSNGKVDREALPSPNSEAYALEAYMAPRTQTEKALVSILADLLKFEEKIISTKDNFFALGGHSLLITVLVARLKEKGFNVNVRSIFNTSSLAGLAAEIDEFTVQENYTVPPNAIPEGCEQITPDMLPLVKLSVKDIEKIVSTVPGGASNIQDIYPLVPSQEGILFHHLMDPINDPYIIPVLLSVPNYLQLENFILALQAVIDRHDVMRTAIITTDLLAPIQVVYRHVQLSVEKLILDATLDAEEQMRSLLQQPRTMNIAQAPLVQLKFAENPHSQQCFILLNMHHIIEDATSLKLIFKELLTHMSKRQDLLLPPVPYRNFIAHTLHQIQTNDSEAFFQETLGDITESTAPFNLLDVHGDGRKIKDLRRSLHPKLACDIRRRARDLHISPASLFHSTWALVVAICSGQKDIVFGTVLSGRLQGISGIERMLGNFINALPLRVNLKNKSVKQLVLDTDIALKELINFEQTSLVLAQSCSGLANDAPLFSSMLNFRHFEHDEEKDTALEAFGIQWLGSIDRTNYPMGVSIDDVGNEFSLNVQTDHSISPAAVMGYMETAIAGIVNALATEETAQAKALDIDIIPESERHTLLIEWNNTIKPYPNEKCLYELFESQVNRIPDNIAVIFGEQKLTYEELNAKSNQVAHYLHQQGVGPDTLVGLCVERSLEMVIGLLGILKAGGAYLPIEPTYPEERISYILENSGVTLLLSQSHLTNQLPITNQQVICLDTKDIFFSQLTANLPKSAFHINPNHLAYVIYTSGSTGRPKGVLVEQRGVVRLVCNPDYYQSDEQTIMLQHTSISFDVATQEILGPLLNGGRLIIYTGETKNIIQLIKCIEETQVNTLCLSAAFLPAFAEASQNKTLSLKYLGIGGEAFSANDVQKLYERNQELIIVNAYGPTENTIASSCYVIPKNTTIENPIPIGKPIAQSTTYVVDQNLKLLPIGVVGELCVGGSGVARGYLNIPLLTQEKFIPNPFTNNSQDRLYKTGDLVRWLADGNLEFIGRIDNQVKIRGFRVELGEIEAVLVAHPSLKSAIVTTHASHNSNKLVAYVCPTLAYLDTVSKVFNADNLSQWTTLFEDQYSDSSSSNTNVIDLNLVGWNSSYTGKLIDEEEMKEWIKGTVQRIVALKPKNLLEIGCGTGLLLYRYAAHCETVHALDISTAALSDLQKELNQRGWSHVHLAHGDALSIDALTGKLFDTVVINSVAQYFPNRLYLEKMIEKLLPCVEDGGKILIGDVRNLDLFSAHLCAIERGRLTQNTPVGLLVRRIQRRLQQEEELLISPSFFSQLSSHYPEITQVDILVKRGLGDNEMLSYRYDVVLTKRSENCTEQSPITWFNMDTIDSIRELLDTQKHSLFGISGFKNARIQEDMALAKGLIKWSASKLISPLKQDMRLSRESVEQIRALESLIQYAENRGYRCETTWSQDCLDQIDIIFSRKEMPAVQARSPYTKSYLTNSPQIVKVGQTLSKTLKEHLAQKLPDYMLPSVYIVLETLPLTPNGKVDKQALPMPDEKDLQKEKYVPPRNEIEEKLCQLIQEVLNLEQVGIQDNFFDLGGHSLLATRLSTRIKQHLGTELPLRSILDGSNVEQMAAILAQQPSIRETLSLKPVDRSREKAMPISFQQTELWFLNQHKNRAISYDNIQIAYRVIGKFKLQTFIKSLKTIVERHEILRSSFIENGGHVQQIVNSADDFSVIVEKLIDENNLYEICKHEKTRPFDKLDSYMIRIRLLELSEISHIVLITRPWGIFDGWSTEIFFSELGVLYKAFSDGHESPLPALPIQYADFAYWQRQWLTKEILQTQEEYWLKQLSGLPPLLQLLTDHPRPSVQNHDGANVNVNLSVELHKQLNRFSQEQGVTLYMTLLSTFSVLLSYYTQQTDLAIGSPISNRPHVELEGLIGYFVNILVMRIDIAGNPRFIDILLQTKQTTMEAYEHKDIPFQDVVKTLRPQLNPSYTPLFQIMFNLINLPPSQITVSDSKESNLSILPVEFKKKSAKFDLNFVIKETSSGLQGYMEYSTDLFDRKTVEQMVWLYENLLMKIITKPNMKLSQFRAIKDEKEMKAEFIA